MHPYHSLPAGSESRCGCFRLRAPTVEQDPEAAALETVDALAAQIKHLQLMRGSVDYRLRELYRQKDGCVGNTAETNACATLIRSKLRQKLQLTRLVTNAQLLQQRLEEASLFAPLAGALAGARLSMESLLARMDPDRIDDLLDGLRDHGAQLRDIESLLAEPLLPEDDLDDDESKEDIELELPTAPTTTATVAKELVPAV